jgi:hypothetical protein
MSKKVVVVILHGAGIHIKPDGTKKMEAALIDRLKKVHKLEPKDLEEIKFCKILWDVDSGLHEREMSLKKNMIKEGIHFGGFFQIPGLGTPRNFIFDLMSDVAAYQPINNLEKDYKKKEDYDTYAAIHTVLAEAFSQLAKDGWGDAHLCIIAHSLGSIIASNYVYDIQGEWDDSKKKLIPKVVDDKIGDTPLEQMRNFEFFVTMGSPLALWSLRYTTFNQPVTVNQCWLNFYDVDDIIAYALEPVIDDDAKANLKDRNINAGDWFTGATPLSHNAYWEDDDVIREISEGLAQLWKEQKINC